MLFVSRMALAYSRLLTMAKVTIKQIASDAGVSWQAVSQVLNGKGRIGLQTRERIWEAAKRLGYKPNAAARAIGSGRFGCAALVVSDNSARSHLPLGLVYGLQEGLARRNMHLTLTRLPDQELTSQGFVPKVLRESMADGIFVNYTHDIPDEMLRLIREQQAPAVWINSKLPTDCVYPDDLNGSRRLTEHLLALGHRRIAYLKTDYSAHYSQADRRAGYEQAMVAAGQMPDVVDREVPGGELYDLFRAILTRLDRPTAVIVRPEDLMLTLVLARELGLQVPHDLSVASIAGAAPAMLGLEITSALVPAEEEGRMAVEMLLEKLDSPGVALPSRCVDFAWFAGTSCGPAPAVAVATRS